LGNSGKAYYFVQIPLLSLMLSEIFRHSISRNSEPTFIDRLIVVIIIIIIVIIGWDVSELLPLTDILLIFQMIWAWRDGRMIYWQGKTEELWEKPVPVPLCPPQIPHGLTQARTRTSRARGRRLTAWAEARPATHPLASDSNVLRCDNSFPGSQLTAAAPLSWRVSRWDIPHFNMSLSVSTGSHARV
jgi:hypothetical protein